MARSTLTKAILYPLSRLYGMGTWVRNKMFDYGICKQRQFDVPIIVVGNLAVGGTGKTPHTEYIVSALGQNRRIGVLSRGYKRATKGFVQATGHSTPRDIGDEAYQIYHKFGGRVMVCVCEDRVRGIEKMLTIDPKLDVIVLDDAFQHRYVKPHIAIVLTEFDRPAFSDHMLPYGRLRESYHGISRADIVVATKCPAEISPLNYHLFITNLDLIPAQSCFFSRFKYERLRPVFVDNVETTPRLSELTDQDTLLCVSGIANPRPFVKYLKSYHAKVKVNIFPDHHEFTRSDMDLLTERFNSMNGVHRYIITTEKDAVRLVNNPYFPHQLKPYIFYLPVRVEFIRRDSGNNTEPTFEETLERLLTQKKFIP